MKYLIEYSLGTSNFTETYEDREKALEAYRINRKYDSKLYIVKPLEVITILKEVEQG